MRNPSNHAGSTILISLGTIAVLAMISGTVLLNTTNRRSTINQSSLWEESLVAAEAGIHQGVAQLEQGLAQNSIPSTQAAQMMTLSHEGNQSSQATVTYKIIRTDLVIGSMQRPYYTIISTGTVALPGGQRGSSDTRDGVLRKLDLSRTKDVSRTLEVIVKPTYNTDGALTTEGGIVLNNHNIVVDSFDSSDSLRSNSGGPGTPGQFNVAPYNSMNANVSTNSTFAEAGNATIYGDLATNGGTTGSTDNVQGAIRDDFSQELAPVYPPTTLPSWSGVTAGVSVPSGNGNGTQTVTNVNKAVTFKGGTPASPARYIVDSITMSGSSDIVTFALGTSGNAPDTSKSTIELYVRGNFTTKGGGNASTTDGSVVLQNGVSVTIYVLGNLTLTGNGVENQNSMATNLTIYGVNAPTPTANQQFKFAGSSQFYGSVYAPGADLVLAGGGSNGTFVGSLVGKSAFMNGNTTIRYDEALSKKGLITRFTPVSWFEDTKHDNLKSGAFNGALSYVP